MSEPAETIKHLAQSRPAVERVLSHLAREHALVMLCDEQEHIAWVSDPHHILSGTIDDQLGQPISEVFPAYAGVDRGHELLAVATPDGASIQVNVRSFPVRSSPGSRIVVGQREEDQRRAAKRMGGSAEVLSSILNSSPDPVIAADLGGFITFANAAAAELLGQPVEALVGRPILSCIPCDQAFAETIDKLRERDVTGHDLELSDAGGSRWVSLSSRRLRLPTGEVVGNVVFLRDVSKRHRAERALEAKNEELESYASHVSHDLRSPLVSVLGFARLLRQDYASLLDEDGRRFLDHIEQAGHTMESLIEDLLEFSRIGQADELDTPIDPVGVIEQVIADRKAEFGDLDVPIEFPSQPPMVMCNRTRAYQLFSNLIGNALIHMGPVTDPCIAIHVDEEADVHHIRVTDNGRGIDPEHHEKIFEMFTTLGKQPDGRKSSGIGLAIVKKIATNRGGSAWVESTPDHGATFHATLRKT